MVYLCCIYGISMLSMVFLCISLVNPWCVYLSVHIVPRCTKHIGHDDANTAQGATHQGPKQVVILPFDSQKPILKTS